MEDQQPAAGDLSADDTEQSPATEAPSTGRRHRMPRGKARRAATEAVREPETSEAAPEVPEAEPETPDAEAAEPKTPVTGTGDTEPESPEVEPEPADGGEASADGEQIADPPQRVVFVERKPPGKRAPIAIGIAAAMFVGASGFAAAMAQPYLAERALVDTKLEIARTATSAITTLWTYTPNDMETLADRSARYLGGDFQAQYRKYIDAIVPTNKQAQVTNRTEVVGAAVESLSGRDATAIVYTNSTSTSPLTKNIPSMRYLSYRLSLHRVGADWRVTGMSAITNLDLTPRL